MLEGSPTVRRVITYLVVILVLLVVLIISASYSWLGAASPGGTVRISGTPSPTQPPDEPTPSPDGGWIVDGVHWKEKPGPMYYVGKSANALAKAGDYEGAITLVDGLISAGAPQQDLAHAHERRGNYLWKLQRHDEAQESLVSALHFYDTNPEFAGVVPHWTSVNLLSHLLEQKGMWEDALAVNDRLIPFVSSMPGEFASTIFTRRANYLNHLGRHEEAASSLDELFSRLPRYYDRHSSSVNLRMRRAEFRDTTRRSEDYILDLLSIWSDPNLTDWPQVDSAGLELARSLHAAGRGAEAVSVYRDIANYYESRWSELQDSSRHGLAAMTRTQLEQRMVSVLGSMTSADAYGRPDLALDAITRMRRYRTTPREQHDLDLQEQGILRRIENNAAQQSR